MGKAEPAVAAQLLAAALAGRGSRDEVRVLWRQLVPDPQPANHFDPDQVADLPEPARRWLTHAIAPGTSLGRAAVLHMRGHIRIGRWLPFRAVQLQAPPLGYLWAARVGWGPANISGFDRYFDGTGEMRWRLLGRIPVVTATGDDVDRAAAGRVALDAFTSPSSWLDPSVTWELGPDDDTVIGQWTIGTHTLRPLLRIAPSGALVSVTMPRWASPNGEPWGHYECGGNLGAEKTFGGVTLPTVLAAGYFFGTDRWDEGEFFRATVTHAFFL